MKSTLNLMEDYYNWLKENYTIKAIDEDTDRITTPFLDPLNDNICLYVIRNGDAIQISDDGYTLNNLAMMGINLIDTRDALIREIIDRFGTSFIGDELTISGRISGFPAMKFKLMASILQINDLVFTNEE